MWCGAYQCWGEENKEAALRTARPPGISEGLVSNFEIKSFDGCANPYLGLAAILAAGIDGLRRHLDLPEPVGKTPATKCYAIFFSLVVENSQLCFAGMNPALFEGKLQRLPRSLSESVEALEHDGVLDDLIGGKLCVAIKAVRKLTVYKKLNITHINKETEREKKRRKQSEEAEEEEEEEEEEEMELKELREAIEKMLVYCHAYTLDNRASETDVSIVRVIWVDTSGQHRCRAVPAKQFNEVVKRIGTSLLSSCMVFPSYHDAVAHGSNLSCSGEIKLMPDLSTLRKIPWDGKDEWVPFESTGYCSTTGYDAASPMFHDIVAALDSLNIPVEQMHKECGKGQLEIVLGHSVCLTSADNLVYAREVIRSVARKHGFIATFVPKYALDDTGSGSHVHVSLWQNGQNVFMGTEAPSSQHGMSGVGREFIYDRIQPNTWSGAYQCWGEENKEAPLRTARPPGILDGLVSNFEIKCFDGCANPHLGLAAIVAAGIDGLRRHLSLPEPVGKLQRLPRSLSESVEALENDNVLDDLIGGNLCAAIKAVRKAEIEYYSKNKEAFKQMIFRY
ncbi:Gamma-glutamylputrescine synthetase [Linum grandiflorum]